MKLSREHLAWTPLKRLKGICMLCHLVFRVMLSEVAQACTQQSICPACLKALRLDHYQRLKRSKDNFVVERTCMGCFAAIPEPIPVDGNGSCLFGNSGARSPTAPV